VGQVSDALSICDEAVPANRFIDGFPAYAQCPAAQNAAIYSNNGVDTALTAAGSDWVRTQYSGGYQCTELAHRYLLFKWNVKWLPNGNAGFWCDDPPSASSGIVQTTSPVHGDVIVFAPGSCGADSTTGHVALVDTVDAAKGKVSAVQQNQASRSSYNFSCAKCFLHVVANDGTSTGVPIPSSGGATSASGGASSTGGAPSGSGGSGRVFPSGGTTGGGGVPTAGGAFGTGGSVSAGGVAPTSSGGATAPSATGGAGPVPNGSGGSGGSGAGGVVGPGTGAAPSSPPSDSNDDSGSSCAVAATPARHGSPWMVLAGAAIAGTRLVRRRRRRTPSD
jgi:hypothetical protein